MNLLEFMQMGGQARRRMLDDFVESINLESLVPPNLRPVTEFIDENQPVNRIGTMMQQSDIVFDPQETMDARMRAGMDMGIEMAMTLTPMALVRMGYMAAPPALAEVFALPVGVEQAAVDALSDAKYATRSLLEGDLGGVKEAFYEGGVPESLGAASSNIFEDLYNPDVNKVKKEVLDPAQLSKQKLPDYVGNIEYEVTPTGNLVAKETVDIADLKDKTLVPAFGDRTYGGAELTNIGGVDLDQPVIMQGGHDFMRDVDTGLWASEKDAMLKKARFIDQLIAKGEDPVLVYTAMGGQSGDFSHHMSNAVMGLVEQSKITKKAAKAYDDKIRETVDPNWVGILDPNVRDYLQNNMTGTDRRLLWQEMDKKMYTDQGFPHVGVARAAITDPDLLTVDPFTTGLSLGKPTGGGLLEAPTKEHFSYSSQIDGPYLGGLEEQVSGDLIWRDFFEGRRNANIPPSGDQRSFMMSPYISQKVDDQMIDQVSSLIEYLRRVGQN